MVRNMNDMNSLYSVSVIIPVHNTGSIFGTMCRICEKSDLKKY